VPTWSSCRPGRARGQRAAADSECELFPAKSRAATQVLNFMSSPESELPPAGLAELLPVLGMFALIIVILLYGCGCLGSSPSTGSKKTLGRPGSGMPPAAFQVEHVTSELKSFS
jgi:hypothetical protein